MYNYLEEYSLKELVKFDIAKSYNLDLAIIDYLKAKARLRNILGNKTTVEEINNLILSYSYSNNIKEVARRSLENPTLYNYIPYNGLYIIIHSNGRDVIKNVSTVKVNNPCGIITYNALLGKRVVEFTHKEHFYCVDEDKLLYKYTDYGLKCLGLI